MNTVIFRTAAPYIAALMFIFSIFVLLRGHNVNVSIGSFGGFQGIMFDPRTGVLMGGSDPRKDGLAIGW